MSKDDNDHGLYASSAKQRIDNQCGVDPQAQYDKLYSKHVGEALRAADSAIFGGPENVSIPSPEDKHMIAALANGMGVGLDVVACDLAQAAPQYRKAQADQKLFTSEEAAITAALGGGVDVMYREVPPAVAEFALQERGQLLKQIERLTSQVGDLENRLAASRLEVSAMSKELSSVAAEELIYLYRRKGFRTFATCDRARWLEFSQSDLFEVRTAYAAERIAELVANAAEATWPKQECPVTGQVNDVDPVDLGLVKPRPEFLELAEISGARITGKPDGSEAIEVIFSIDAWRAFDAAVQLHSALTTLLTPTFVPVGFYWQYPDAADRVDGPFFGTPSADAINHAGERGAEPRSLYVKLQVAQGGDL